MRRKSFFGLIVVVALGAIAASATPASAASFKLGSYPNMYTGGPETSTAVGFVFDATTFTCATAPLTGAEIASATTATRVTFGFAGCTVGGSATFPVTVTMNGCEFELLEPTGTGPYTGNLSIVCPPGKLIVVNGTFLGSTCKVEVAAQANKGSIGYANMVGSPSKFTANANVTGIAYKKVTDSGICPLSGTGEAANGGFVGQLEVGATGGVGAFIG